MTAASLRQNVIAEQGTELAAAAERAVALAKAAKSDNTRKAYAADWKRFEDWCRLKRLQALPADPVTIGLFIADVSGGRAGLAASTVSRIVSGIASAHRSKGLNLDRRHPAIADVLQGLRRKNKGQRKRATPLLQDGLRKILDATSTDLRGLRDRALLLLGWASAFRRSELAAMQVEHLTESKEGYLLFLPSSKTDQEGEGVTIGIPRGKRGLCPVESVKAWLAAADIDQGPVFRRINKWGAVEMAQLTDQSVRLILLKRADMAGLSATERVGLSGHSLRAGFITAAYEKDVPEQATQRHVRHKQADTTRSYNRVVSAFKQNPAKTLLE